MILVPLEGERDITPPCIYDRLLSRIYDSRRHWPRGGGRSFGPRAKVKKHGFFESYHATKDASEVSTSRDVIFRQPLQTAVRIEAIDACIPQVQDNALRREMMIQLKVVAIPSS